MSAEDFVKLSVRYRTDFQFTRTSPFAELLFLRALAYCGLHNTSGAIPQPALAEIGHGLRNPERLAAELVDHDYWDPPSPCPSASGWTSTCHRPKAHHDAAGAARDRHRLTRPGKRPDIDKLTRAVLDGITESGLWQDDSLVVSLRGREVVRLGIARRRGAHHRRGDVDMSAGHVGRIVAVYDAHGYTIGSTATCSCGWESGDLRDTPGAALIDHWNHLRDALATTKETV